MNAPPPRPAARPQTKAYTPAAGSRAASMPVIPDGQLVRGLVAQALAEDLGAGDATTDAVCSQPLPLRAWIQAKQAGVLAGMSVAAEVFRQLDNTLLWRPRSRDGATLVAGQRLVEIYGDQRMVLKGERTALNFLQRLSGIATLTSRYVAEVRGLQATIMDTRKTTPGLRALEKYAVACGGGSNHRFGLYDQVLIKENHIRAAGGLAKAVAAARARWGRTLLIEVEAETLAEVREALRAGADIIMLDDMSLEDMRTAVAWVAKRVPLEASGSMRLETVRQVAATGVARISVGALTHSAPALDLALNFEPPPAP